MKYIKTPVVVGPYSNLVHDKDGFIVANCTSTEDAAEIVTALNAHDKLVEACKEAQSHISELRDAWMAGAISSCDGQDGQRANRNVDVDVQLRAAISLAGETP